MGSRMQKHEPVQLDAAKGEVESREAELSVLISQSHVLIGNAPKIPYEVLELRVCRLRWKEMIFLCK